MNTLLATPEVRIRGLNISLRHSSKSTFTQLMKTVQRLSHFVPNGKLVVLHNDTVETHADLVKSQDDLGALLGSPKVRTLEFWAIAGETVKACKLNGYPEEFAFEDCALAFQPGA